MDLFEASYQCCSCRYLPISLTNPDIHVGGGVVVKTNMTETVSDIKLVLVTEIVLTKS